jgi:hypothetical protein
LPDGRGEASIIGGLTTTDSPKGKQFDNLHTCCQSLM